MTEQNLIKKAEDLDVYQKLQEHLDEFPVGFPATQSGVEIRLLKYLFTPDEAKLATRLSYKYESIDSIYIGFQLVYHSLYIKFRRYYYY